MPPVNYCHHRIACAPLTWRTAADAIQAASASNLPAEGGTLYGIWRSQIGRPRDELNAITAWTSDAPALETATRLTAGIEHVRSHTTTMMQSTLRPEQPSPPTRQGNYAFRWFNTPPANWDEFLDLCASAWPGFEAAYDSQVIGLWRLSTPAENGNIGSLLLTRRPNLAMWERSKIPENEAEADVRRKLSRRYDLCDATSVETATLLTANDREDTARWT